MKFSFAYITVLTLTLLLIFQIVNGQEKNTQVDTVRMRQFLTSRPSIRQSNAQINNTGAAAPKREILKLPVIGYRQETGLRLGLRLKLIFTPEPEKAPAADNRPTVITPMITYGLKNKQLTTSLQTDIYAIKGWQLHTDFRYIINELNYYFGVGNQSKRVHKQPYESNTLLLEGSMFKRITSRFSIGVGYSIQHNTPLEFEAAADPNTAGIRGGWNLGVGPAVQVDQRDNILFPTKGSLFDAAIYRYGLAGMGSYDYNEVKVDYRKYIPTNLLVKGSVFAFQAFFNGTWGGTVPFYKLPYITDDRTLRGMSRNLYVDQQVMSLQGEFRSFFSSRSTKYGYSIFAGAADGASNFLDRYARDIKVVYGAGLRSQLIPSQRLDLRLDAAFSSKGDVGVHGGVGVSF